MSDVVDLIEQDHHELKRLFNELLTKPETRAANVPVMVTLLTAHSRAEEAEVYPAASEAGGAEEVKHSQEEHLEADQLAAEVASADPEADDFVTKLQELIDAVTHHMEEEESTVLPGLRERMDADALNTLADAFLSSRAEHLGDMPEDITKDELEQQAENAEKDVPSGATKDEVQEELRKGA
ncbi:MAG TPA: hemerythrin domain-containing protein [Aeromicrobium sp.]|nr:hemerythrin domain-containing protein [Aeromicrobium sp.]